MDFRPTQPTPPLLTIENIKQNLCVPKDRPFFLLWPVHKAREWASSKKAGHKVLAQSWKDSSYPDTWQNNVVVFDKFFELASQAMAELSSGTVHVLLPSDMQGRDWWPTTVWNWYERHNFGLLVTNIIRINPENDH